MILSFAEADMEFVNSLTPVRLPTILILTGENACLATYFGQKLRMENVLLIYFEQIVSFCAIIYSNKNSLKLFCKNSSLNSANFTD